MSERRWYNPRLPQTLVISQFLLYFNAVFLALGLLTGGLLSSFLGAVLLLGSLAANVYGAWGIANEMKRGYQVAVVASFLPIAVRLVVALEAGAVMSNLGFIFIPGGILNAMFVYALIALLLHTQSREYQRVWFS
jgi:hypothetical protein